LTSRSRRPVLASVDARASDQLQRALASNELSAEEVETWVVIALQLPTYIIASRRSPISSYRERCRAVSPSLFYVQSTKMARTIFFSQDRQYRCMLTRRWPDSSTVRVAWCDTGTHARNENGYPLAAIHTQLQAVSFELVSRACPFKLVPHPTPPLRVILSNQIHCQQNPVITNKRGIYG
jgi:hypothetical protein